MKLIRRQNILRLNCRRTKYWTDEKNPQLNNRKKNIQETKYKKKKKTKSVRGQNIRYLNKTKYPLTKHLSAKCLQHEIIY